MQLKQFVELPPVRASCGGGLGLATAGGLLELVDDEAGAAPDASDAGPVPEGGRITLSAGAAVVPAGGGAGGAGGAGRGGAAAAVMLGGGLAVIADGSWPGSGRAGRSATTVPTVPPTTATAPTMANKAPRRLPAGVAPADSRVRPTSVGTGGARSASLPDAAEYVSAETASLVGTRSSGAIGVTVWLPAGGMRLRPRALWIRVSTWELRASA